MARHRAIDLMRLHPSGFLSSLAKSLEEACTHGHAGRINTAVLEQRFIDRNDRWRIAAHVAEPPSPQMLFDDVIATDRGGRRAWSLNWLRQKKKAR